MLYCPSWLRARERSRPRRPWFSRPVLEVLEDRIAPTGAGSVIDSDPAPVGFPIGYISDAVIPSGLPHAGDVAVAAAGGVGNWPAPNNAYFGVALYTPQRTLDTAFGNGGSVTTKVSGSATMQNGIGVAIQPDGKIVVGSSLNGANFELARYTTSGTLDKTFGKGGLVNSTIFGGAEAVEGLAIETINGQTKIVAAGFVYNGDVAVARYNLDGSLDTSFGSGGAVATPLISGARGYSVAVQPDQKILVGGFAAVSGANLGCVVRFNTNGTLDTTFGNAQGYAVMPNVPNSTVINLSNLALDSAGNIVAQGSAYGVAIARFTSSGILDTTFNSQGYVITSIGPEGAWAKSNGLAIQSNGLIVVGGNSALACYHSGEGADSNNVAGTPDSVFGSNGIVSPAFAGGNHEVAIQPVGTSYQIVTVYISNGNEGVAWYQPDDSSTPSPVLEASAPHHPVQQTLTAQQLQPVVQTAIADWQAAGASAAQVALLKSVPIYISPPPPGYLGGEANNQIWISPNADGWGWYTGTALPPKGGTPTVGVPASAGSVPGERMDLLSVVTHELGHVLGLGDTNNLADVMGLTLSAGVRRLPTPADVLQTGTVPANEPEASATVLVQVLSERVRTSAPVAYASGSLASPGAPAASLPPVLVDTRKANLTISPAGQSAAKSPAVVDKLFALYEVLGTEWQW